MHSVAHVVRRTVTSAKAYVLTAYPCSPEFQSEVERIAGPGVHFLRVGELRRKGFWGLIRFARKLNREAAFYVPLEDPESKAILPLLIGLATLCGANRIVVVESDCSVRALSRADAMAAILRAALASLEGIAAAIRSELLARWLLFRKRKEYPDWAASRKIFYLNTVHWFGARVGGSVGHIAGVVNGFSDMGYEVDFACFNLHPMLRPEVRQIPIRGLDAHGYPQELNIVRLNFRAWHALKGLVRDHYAFLYQRLTVLSFVGVMLSRLWRVPLVLEFNGSEVWVSRNWGTALRFSRLATAMENLCFRHAHRVVVVSQVLADEVVARGVDRTRIVYYPNCVDPSHFDPGAIPESAPASIRERYCIHGDEILITFIGTFGRWHGAPVLARAIRTMVDGDQEWLSERRVRFAMIGDGATMAEVRSILSSPECSRWVVYTGLVQQSEAVKYLAASDILVSPHVANADGSQFFGSPTKLFEYMAMAKGVVASDLDQIGEVLANGIRIWKEEPGDGSGATAILVRPGDVEELIRGIRLLVERPDLRRALGENARRELLSKYTWRHHVGQILRSMKGRRVAAELSKTEDSVLIS